MGTPNPASLGAFGLGMEAFGVGYSTIGAYNQAKTQKDVLNYDAAVAGNNAKIAGYQADVAQQVGAQQEQGARLQTASLFSTQRASMAANGVDLGEGSATDILNSTKYLGEHDVMTIRDNTNRQVWGLRNEQNSYLAEQNATLAARNAINPWRSAAGTLLSGATQFASSWYSYNKDLPKDLPDAPPKKQEQKASNPWTPM